MMPEFFVFPLITVAMLFFFKMCQHLNRQNLLLSVVTALQQVLNRHLPL